MQLSLSPLSDFDELQSAKPCIHIFDIRLMPSSLFDYKTETYLYTTKVHFSTASESVLTIRGAR